MSVSARQFLYFRQALWSFLAVILVYVPTLWLAESIDRSVRDELVYWLHRSALIVAPFVLSSAIIFADLIPAKVFGRVTTLLIVVVWIHLSFVAWVWYGPEILRFESVAPFQYRMMLLSAVLGSWMWWRIRQLHLIAAALQKETIQSQFSTASVLVWSALTCVIVSLLNNTGVYQKFDFWNVQSFWQPVAIAVVLSLVLLVTTNWLLRTRHFNFAAAHVLIVVFAGGWIWFGVKGLTEVQYNGDDRYVVKILVMTLTMLLYLALISVPAVLLRRNSRSIQRNADLPSFPWLRLMASRAFYTIATCLWAWLVVWVLISFCVPFKTRSLDWFDSSPVVMAALEDSFGKDTIEIVRADSNPKDLRKWLDCLGQHAAPIETDLKYQIEKIPYLSFKYQGKTIPAIAQSLSNATIHDYNSSLISDIREAISASDACFLKPQRAFNYPLEPKAIEFAIRLLLTDTCIAISEEKWNGVYENLEATIKLARIVEQNEHWLLAGKKRKAIENTLILAIMLGNAEEPQLARLDELFSKAQTLNSRASTKRGTQFATWMLGVKWDFDPNWSRDELSGHRAPEDLSTKLTHRFSQTIDWKTYIHSAATLKRQCDALYELQTPDRHRIVSQALKQLELEPRFHEQAVTLFATPSYRARKLAERDFLEGQLMMVRHNTYSELLSRLRLAAWTLLRDRKNGFPDSLDSADERFVDPFTGSTFIFRNDGDRFLLYSCGPDQIDNGGDPIKSDDIPFRWPEASIGDFIQDYRG